MGSSGVQVSLPLPRRNVKALKKVQRKLSFDTSQEKEGIIMNKNIILVTILVTIFLIHSSSAG